MDGFLSFAIVYVALTTARLSTTVRAGVAKPAGYEALSVLLLASTDSSYNSSSSTLSKLVDELLKGANENESYQLQLLSLDTQCNQESALNGFIDQVCSDEDEWFSSGEAAMLIAVLGGGCVTDSELIADTISHWNIPLISYSPFLYTSATSPLNSGVFHFQMYPSLRGVATALVATLQQYGWTQMSIISEFNYPFLQMELDLVSTLTAANITVLQPSHIRKGDNPMDIPYLFAKYARIVFFNMYENKATEILCHAFQEGKYYPDYVWILYGWYSNSWWTRTSTSCNSSQLMTALERAIILQSYPINQGIADDLVNGYDYSYIAPLLNDSVQLLIQAVSKSIALLCAESCACLNGSLDWSCVNSTSFGDFVRSMLLNTSFEGQSGHVEFDESGTRVYSKVELFQFRNGSDDSCFANVQLETTEFYYNQDESNESVWPDGIPQDGSPVDVVSEFSLMVVGVIYTFSFAGIVFTLTCFGFNIIFRKRKVVKLTSPNLNYFIILGALSLYIGSFIRVTPSTSLVIWDHVCRALAPTLCIGYSLCFGTILAKMWRIYYIFHNPTTKKKEVKDWHLAVFILVILAINVVITSLGFIIPACRPAAYLASDGEHQPVENEKGIIENYFVINCFSRISFYWQLVLYLYLAILQTAALVLAFKTRKVKIKVLNDSKEITAIIYVISVIDAELIVVSLLLQNYNNIQELLFTGGVLIATTILLGLVYLPKMIALYRDPQGKRIFGNRVIHSSEATERVTLQAERSRVIALEKEVQSLQTLLKQQQSFDETVNGKEANA